jgi:hypothetical protein
MDNKRYVTKKEDEKEKNIIIFDNYVSVDRCCIYSIFHTLMIFFALYLTFRCKNFGSPNIFFEVLFAIFCPYFYIMWILVNHGTCDIIPGEIRPKV